MKRRIVLTRSTIGAVFGERRKAVIRLAPAHIETLEDPGADGATTRFERDAIIELYDPGPHAVLLQLPTSIAASTLSVDTARYGDHVPLPMVTGGAVQLRIQTSSGETLNIRGRGIAAIFIGPRAYDD